MVELTQAGWWFKWSSLDRHDKQLAVFSLIASIPAGVLVGALGGDAGHRAGRALASGTAAPSDSLLAALGQDGYALFVLIAALLAVASAVAWWRFSVRQDELFNRIQNHALGQAGGWTLAIAGMGWLLERGEWVPAIPLGAIVLTGYALLLIFWFRAVRTWAS